MRRGSYAPDTVAGFVEILADFKANAAANDPFFDREIAVSMLVDEVEAIWDKIAANDDWSALHDKVADIRAMGAALGPTY